jgi:hypothetical protein
MREGDQVWVIPNCDWLVLLRPTPLGFVNVGCAFVLGLSEGEAGDMVKRGELKVEHIDIH